MPSENKTTNIGLNQWQGNENLRRQDLVDDNAAIDAAIGNRTIDDAKIPNANDNTSLSTLLSWLGNMIKSITGKTSWRTAPVKSIEQLNNDVATHSADTAAHGATSTATASRIIARDANGRAKVAAPSVADDIARKDTVDAVQVELQNTKMDKSGGEFTGSVSLKMADLIFKADSDRVVYFKNAAGTVEYGYVGRINTSANKYMTIQNSVYGSGVSIYDNGELKFGSNNIWHTGNDGPGSGLDADTLDGVHLTGLAETKYRTDTNMNTITQSGMYRVDSPANLPPDANSYGQLIVSRNLDTITQIYCDYATGNLFTRSGAPPEVGGAGVWTPWKQIICADGGRFSGIVKAQNNTSYTTAQMRNVIISTGDPSGGSNGDIWIKYKS